MNAELLADDGRSDEQIIAAALALACEEDSHEYWLDVRILQHRMAMPLLERMRELILKGSEQQRQFAADVMAQGRAKDKKFSGQCVQLLLETLQHEKSLKVLVAICNAFGHHKSEIATAPLTKLQNHHDANVRLAVVHGLYSLKDPAAITALISLSADTDREVRNWATFGLGSMTETDTVQLRNALVERLTESDGEILGEALVGLALRGDVRVAQPLLQAVNAAYMKQNGFSPLLVEAVEAIRITAAKHPHEAWKPILSRCDELGINESTD